MWSTWSDEWNSMECVEDDSRYDRNYEMDAYVFIKIDNLEQASKEDVKYLKSNALSLKTR